MSTSREYERASEASWPSWFTDSPSESWILPLAPLIVRANFGPVDVQMHASVNTWRRLGDDCAKGALCFSMSRAIAVTSLEQLLTLCLVPLVHRASRDRYIVFQGDSRGYVLDIGVRGQRWNVRVDPFHSVDIERRLLRTKDGQFEKTWIWMGPYESLYISRSLDNEEMRRPRMYWDSKRNEDGQPAPVSRAYSIILPVAADLLPPPIVGAAALQELLDKNKAWRQRAQERER